MGQVVTDVQIVNGKIRVFFGPCCYRDIGSAPDLTSSDDSEPEVTNPYDDTTNEGEDWQLSGCAKATGMINLLWGVVESAWTYRNSGALFYSNVKADWPSISFNNLYLTTLYAKMMSIQVMDWVDPLDLLIPGLSGDVLWDGNAIFDQRRKQIWICRFAPMLPDNGDRPTDDDIVKMLNLAEAFYPIVIAGLFTWAAKAIGYGDLKDAGVMAAANIDAECGCPDLSRSREVTFNPLPNSWYLGEWSDELSLTNITNSGVFDTAYIDNHELAEDCFGWALIITSRTSGQVRGCTPIEAGMETGSTPIVKGGTSFSTIPLAIQLTCNNLAFNDIAVANPNVSLYWAGEEDAASADFSNDPEAPTFAAGAYINWAFRNHWNQATDLTFRVAPLFNAASLSHQS